MAGLIARPVALGADRAARCRQSPVLQVAYFSASTLTKQARKIDRKTFDLNWFWPEQSQPAAARSGTDEDEVDGSSFDSLEVASVEGACGSLGGRLQWHV